MAHKEYKQKLGKKLKDMTKEELRKYNRLKYKTTDKAAYRRKRRAQGKDLNEWNKISFNSVASLHNSKMRSRWESARESSLSTKELSDWLREQKQVCYLCGTECLGIDHIIPLSQGGEHSTANMAICCTSCNSTKNNLSPQELEQAIPSRVAGLEARIAEIEQEIEKLRLMQTNLAKLNRS